MLRGLIVSAVALAATSGGLAPGHGPMGQVAFVSVEDASQLVAVDLDSKRVVARIPVPRGPHNVAAAEDLVLVTSPRAGRVTLVDGARLRVLKVFRGFGYPHDVEVEGARAYVTDEARGEVVVLDLRSRSIVARLRVGSRPHDLAVADVAIVTHGPRDSALTLVGIQGQQRARTLRRLRVGGAPHDISKQPDTANVYVTYWGSGSVAAIDWGRGRVLWRRHVGSLIHHVQFDYFSGRRLWATDHASGRTYLLSARDDGVLRTLSSCPGAHHVALAGKTRVVVACHDANAIAVYDTTTGRRTMIPVGAGPHGVAVVLTR